jgi:hypothetical protein
MSDPTCKCGNCGWIGALSETSETHDFWSRVNPGETMPAGDCPKCGALAFVDDEDFRLQGAARDLLAALRELVIWCDAPGVPVKPGTVIDNARAAIAKATG